MVKCTHKALVRSLLTTSILAQERGVWDEATDDGQPNCKARYRMYKLSIEVLAWLVSAIPSGNSNYFTVGTE